MNINNLNPANIALFKSRKFWAAAMELVFMVVVALVPELESSASVLILASMAIVAVVIHGFAVEDKVLAEKTGVRNAKYDNMSIM